MDDSVNIMKTTKEILIEARKLIEHGWCQGSLAKTIYGESVDEQHPSARYFCTAGAIYKAEPNNTRAELIIDEIEEEFKGTWSFISKWNDSPDRTKEDVLVLFDKAIAFHKD